MKLPEAATVHFGRLRLASHIAVAAITTSTFSAIHITGAPS